MGGGFFTGYFLWNAQLGHVGRSIEASLLPSGRFHRKELQLVSPGASSLGAGFRNQRAAEYVLVPTKPEMMKWSPLKPFWAVSFFWHLFALCLRSVRICLGVSLGAAKITGNAVRALFAHACPVLALCLRAGRGLPALCWHLFHAVWALPALRRALLARWGTLPALCWRSVRALVALCPRCVSALFAFCWRSGRALPAVCWRSGRALPVL